MTEPKKVPAGVAAPAMVAAPAAPAKKVPAKKVPAKKVPAAPAAPAAPADPTVPKMSKMPSGRLRAMQRMQKLRRMKEMEGMKPLLVDIMAPRSTNQMVGNTKALRSVNTWVQSAARRDKPIQALFMTGPPGVGKTCSAHLALASAGFTNIHEINASDVNTVSKLVTEIARLGATGASNTPCTTAIIVEEVDGLIATTTRGRLVGDAWRALEYVPKRKKTKMKKPGRKIKMPGEAVEEDDEEGEEDAIVVRKASTAFSVLIKMAKRIPQTMVPVIFTANDRPSDRIRQLVDASQEVRFYPNDAYSMVNYAKRNMPRKYLVSDESLMKAATLACGDMRSFINRIEMENLVGGTSNSFDARQVKRELAEDERHFTVFTALDRIMYNTGKASVDALMRAAESDGRISSAVANNAYRSIAKADAVPRIAKHLSDTCNMSSDVGACMKSWGVWMSRFEGKSRSVPSFNSDGKYVFVRPGARARAASTARGKTMTRLPATRTSGSAIDTRMAMGLYASMAVDPDDRRLITRWGERRDAIPGSRQKKLNVSSASDPLKVFGVSKTEVTKLKKDMAIKSVHGGIEMGIHGRTTII